MNDPKGNAITSIPIHAVFSPHEARDRQHLDALTVSMEADGWQGRPLLVLAGAGEEGGQAWTGSHRLAAARAAGLQEVPAVIVDLAVVEAAAAELGWTSLEAVPDDEDRLAVLEAAGLQAGADLVRLELKART
jgi:ParB-like chromosome segregation protein Spo0J